MVYQVLYGNQNRNHQFIVCDNDEEAKKVALSIYRGYQINHSAQGFCVIKRGYGFDISRSDYDIMVIDCI